MEQLALYVPTKPASHEEMVELEKIMSGLGVKVRFNLAGTMFFKEVSSHADN